MRELMKGAFFNACKYSGLYSAMRRKQKNGIVVLTYHSVVRDIPQSIHRFEYRNCVTEKQFANQIRFLLKHYSPVRINDLIEGRYPEDKPGFLITFDDGFLNNLERATPILNEYGIEGCFFISTGLVGHREMIWPEKITYLLMGSNNPVVFLQMGDVHTFKLDTPESRESASWKIRKYLKNANKQEIEKVMKELEEQITDFEELTDAQKQERYAFMSWDDVNKLKNSGQAIGSHTHNHEVLSTLSGWQSAEELQHSKDLLTKHSGEECTYFSYPNGAAGDFNELHKQQLQEIGYRCAMTQIEGTNFSGGDAFELKRINISQMMTPAVFEAAVSEFLGRVKKVGG